MNIQTINAGSDSEAHDKWKEYVKQAKQFPNDKSIRDLRDVYNQAKLGYKLIDITEVIRAGGTYKIPHEGTNWKVPKLAIAQATFKICVCKYRMNGDVSYHTNSWQDKRSDIILPKCLETYTWQDNATYRSKELSAPIPHIPKNVWNKKLTAAHYILWEVDKWDTKVASEDPFLLKRITKTIFVIKAQWDLTELERKVMSEYL